MAHLDGAMSLSTKPFRCLLRGLVIDMPLKINVANGRLLVEDAEPVEGHCLTLLQDSRAVVNRQEGRLAGTATQRDCIGGP